MICSIALFWATKNIQKPAREQRRIDAAIAAEKARRGLLIKHARDLAQAKEIRALVKGAEKRLPADQDIGGFCQWRKWAEQVADEMDPITNSAAEPLWTEYRLDERET